MSDDRDPSGMPTYTNGQPSLKDRVRELQLNNRLDGNNVGSGSSGAAWLPWLLCIFMAVAWAGVGIRWYKTTAKPATPTLGEAAANPATANTQTISSGEIVLSSKGYLIPSHSIPISPIDVSGRVIRLEIEEGMTFKKGDVLAEIDSTRFQADKLEAEAQYAAAEARYQETKLTLTFERQQTFAELAEAKAQWETDKQKYKTAESTRPGAVAPLELRTLETTMNATKERVNVMEIKNEMMKGQPRERRIIAMERDMEAAAARLKRAEWQLGNCTIKAPVTGVILTKKAEYGSLINPVVGGVSTSLCEMADLREIEVDLEIAERDIAKIEVDMKCRIRSDAFPDRLYEGYFDRMMPIANRARGIIPVRVRVIIPVDEIQGKYLKPEMGVSVSFISEKVDPTVKKAVQLNGEVGPMPQEVKNEPKPQS